MSINHIHEYSYTKHYKRFTKTKNYKARERNERPYICAALPACCPRETMPYSMGRHGHRPWTLFHATPHSTLPVRGGCGNLCAEHAISSQLWFFGPCAGNASQPSPTLEREENSIPGSLGNHPRSRPQQHVPILRPPPVEEPSVGAGGRGAVTGSLGAGVDRRAAQVYIFG